jgi:hypothetical protein
LFSQEKFFKIAWFFDAYAWHELPNMTDAADEAMLNPSIEEQLEKSRYSPAHL